MSSLRVRACFCEERTILKENILEKSPLIMVFHYQPPTHFNDFLIEQYARENRSKLECALHGWVRSLGSALSLRSFGRFGCAEHVLLQTCQPSLPKQGSVLFFDSTSHFIE